MIVILLREIKKIFWDEKERSVSKGINLFGKLKTEGIYNKNDK